jgi:outer membrane protein assembly factor BamD
MKIHRHIIISIIALLLTSCASEPSGPADAFKGQSAEKIFNKAEKALAKGHYEDAAKAFEAIDIMYPFSTHAQKSQLDIIYAYYKNGDMDSAIAAAGRYIHLYPASSSVDYAYYIKGIANFDKTRSWVDTIYKRDPAIRDLSPMREAFVDFNELLTLFPNSKYAPDARNRMVYIRNLIAKYELSVAEYYMRRKAYVAAVNRASYIVAHLEGALQVKDALKIMIDGYTKLGATKEAAEAQRVFDLNFAESKNG